MDTRCIKTTFLRFATIMVILAITLSVSLVAYAAPPSPFVGHWEAIDVDGSDIRLSISGPPNGPYQITWTESYISFCGGEAGIVRGVGWLNEEDANLLESDLHVECFTTGASLDFHLTWQYHPTTNTLSSIYESGFVTIWHRPGGGQVEDPPALGLRVIYGYDWVHSFYEGGHMVWLTVTESDGVTVKATAELVTESLDSLGGETGFDIRLEGWIPAPPDIQPYDWVYGWVDNGASAHVQIGDISGMIDLDNDSIEGMISAPWFSSELDVDCHPWGVPLPEEILKYDAVLPDGEDTYFCSWAEEWDIQPGQDVGVGYSEPDGNWVANVFSVPLPSFAAYMPSAIEGYDWPLGNTITLNINDGVYTAQAISEQRPDFPEGETRVLFELWRDDFSMEAGDHILMTDEASGFSKELYVADLQVLEIDLSTQTVSGLYEPAYPDFWVWLDGQEPLDVQFDENTWVATFAEMVPGTWGTVAQDDWDHDGTVWDFNVPNTRFTVWPEQNYLEGYEWLDGAVVSISVDGKEVCSTEAVSGYPDWDPSNTFFSLNFPEGCTIGVGDFITLSDESLSLTHQILDLVIIEVNADNDTVAGTAVYDPEQYILHTWIHGVDGSYMQLSTDGGAWLADFSLLEGGLQPGMGGRVELVDQASNATAVEWYIPNPLITVFPESEYLQGYDWPDGATVAITVEDKPDCSLERESWGGFFDGNFPEGCDLVIGDTVTYTDGATIRTHVVRNLAITDVDMAANTVAGTAGIGEVVSVGAYDFGGESERWLTVEDGNWLADFTSTDVVLAEGMCGYARIYDEAGNWTQVDWCIPNPRFTVFPEWEWFDGYDWPDGAIVTISVEGKPECATEGVSSGNFFNGGFPDGCDIAVDDVVNFTDGETIRTHTVENLAITAVDKVANTVTGTADEGAVVYAWVHEYGYDMQLQVEDGTWLADFETTGLDLVENMGGRVEVRDEFGNGTAVDWWIPMPEIRAWLGNQRVEGYQWPLEAWVDLYINGDFIESQQVQGDGNWTFVGFDLNGWVLAPGQEITMSGGGTEKIHTILPVSITSVDTELNVVAGTSSNDGRILLCIYDGGCEPPAEIFADSSGYWQNDYGDQFDIQPGFGMDATEFDDDGDGTSFDYWVPQTIFLRPSCGDTYEVQAEIPLEIRYGSWVAIGEELAIQNAEHLTVEMVLNGETVIGEKQPVVPRSEIPCGMPLDDAFGVYYVAQVDPLSPGTYVATVTWFFDIAVTDGYDADGDGVPEWYGPGEVFTREFTIIVP